MKPVPIAPRSRSVLCALAAAVLLTLLPIAAAAQDRAAAPGASDAIVRTVAQAVSADCVPEDGLQATPPAAVPVLPPEGFLAEPRFIRRGINFATRTVGDGTNSGNGFFPEFSNMPTGSGWISAGPGYRQWLLDDRLFVEGSAAVSWRMYKMAQARVELPKLARSRLTIGSQVLWQDLTQVTYFGIGPDTAEDDRSEYRVKSTDVVGYAAFRPQPSLSIAFRGGWLKRPTLLSPAGTFKRGNPDALTTFIEDVAIAQPYQPNYLHEELSITRDTRDFRSHPTSGAMYRGAVSAYSDRSGGQFSFSRYEAEAAQFIPLADRRIVLAAHAWLVGTGTTDNQTVPFYLMPSLGGGNTVRAYTDYRFHDRNLLVVNAESRFAIWTHLDLAAFVDAGNVAPKFSELNLDKTAYGLGIRMHSDRATFLRAEVAHGAEGWRFIVRTNDPLHLSRLSRRVATLPFVP